MKVFFRLEKRRILQQLSYFLQKLFVRLVERAEVGTVDIKDGNDLSVMQNRYYDLAIGSRGTGDMSGELMDVRYDNGLSPLPSRADSICGRRVWYVSILFIMII